MKDLKKSMEELMKQEFIPSEEIPSIDLYIDQIITLLDERLSRSKRTPGDKVITKTMINNYSKDGLLKRTKGKKYSKDHVLMMVLICGLKQGLAVQDIARILSGLESRLSNADGGYRHETVDQLYTAYVTAGDITAATLPDYIDNMVQLLGDAGSDDPMPAIMVLTAVSALCKRTAEGLIDECFPMDEKK